MSTPRKSRRNGRETNSRTGAGSSDVAQPDYSCSDCGLYPDEVLDAFAEDEETPQFKAWLAEQIEVCTSKISPEQIADMTAIQPRWLENRTRFYLRLHEEWSSSRFGAFMGVQIDAYDAGRLPAYDQDMMDKTLPGWRSSAARSFCGRPG